MTVVDVPGEVRAVLATFVSCEFATIGRDGAPRVWPAVPLFLPERGQMLLTTAIGFAVKAANIRRDPRVSLLFSDATGSGSASAPVVLVQGWASVGDEVVTWNDDLAAHWRRVRAVQPSSRYFTAPGIRWFLDWYFMRLLIYVRIRRVTWWDADASGPAAVWEVPDEG